ncbi:MAG TPA: hypothetical protein DEF59_01725 [Candidatus Magasanikbacteria bacterium]|nr:hypothetical protein [Candidatus Magasanikbacteria bacterium]
MMNLLVLQKDVRGANPQVEPLLPVGVEMLDTNVRQMMRQAVRLKVVNGALLPEGRQLPDGVKPPEIAQ